MNKKLGLLLISLLVFVFPYFVNAESKFDVSISGPASASSKEEIEFVVSVNSTDQAKQFETTLKYDNKILQFINITKKDSWEGVNPLQDSGNVNLKFTNLGTTGETKVFSLKFRVKTSNKNSTTITLEDMKLTINSSGENEGNTVLTQQAQKKEIAIKSDDNTLRTIKIDGKAISGFSSGVYLYNLEVDALSDSIVIDSTLSDQKNSTYEENYGNRTVTLKYGENIVLIKVKSESGKVSTYTLKITRKDDRVANTDLKSIIINGGKVKINFDKSVLSYTLKTFKLEKLEIDATPDDSNSKVEIDAPKKLIIGENKVKITVTAVTGVSKNYILIINNTEVPTDTRLRNLAVKGYNIEFDSDKNKYTILYDKSFKNGLTIYETTLSEDVKVDITGNSNLKEGSVVKIIVTALDESSTTEYTIILEKDTRINFFLILDLVIGAVLIVLIVKQLKKRKKLKQISIEKKEEELEKTKELKF